LHPLFYLHGAACGDAIIEVLDDAACASSNEKNRQAEKQWGHLIISGWIN